MTDLTVTGRLERPRPQRRAAAHPGDHVDEPLPLDPVAPGPRAQPVGPARVARQLALAYHVEDLIESGQVRDYAHVARSLGLTRARLSQIVALRYLPVAIQESILAGTQTCSERDLRGAAAMPCTVATGTA